MNKGSMYFQSMTAAMRVKDILSKNSIKAELVKKTGMNGCIWGIEYDRENEKEVKRIVGNL